MSSHSSTKVSENVNLYSLSIQSRINNKGNISPKKNNPQPPTKKKTLILFSGKRESISYSPGSPENHDDKKIPLLFQYESPSDIHLMKKYDIQEDIEDELYPNKLKKNVIPLEMQSLHEHHCPTKVIKLNDQKFDFLVRSKTIIKFTIPVLFHSMILILLETITLFFIGQYSDTVTYSAVGKLYILLFLMILYIRTW